MPKNRKFGNTRNAEDEDVLLLVAPNLAVTSKQSADLWTHVGISTNHTFQTGGRSSYFDWYICCSKEETGMKAT